MTATMKVVCAWCKMVMRPGADENISHGCCCVCKNKYFPCIGEGSNCQLEVINQEHEDMMAHNNGPRVIPSHIDTVECRHCKRVETLEPYDCDCAYPEID